MTLSRVGERRRQQISRIGLFLIALPLGLTAQSADKIEFFEKEVRPLLAAQCYGCHSSKAPTKFAGLTLDSAAGVQKGSDTGPVIVPGKPDESKLMKAVRGQLPVRMPPTGKLKDAQIQTLAKWIEMGAEFPGASVAPSTGAVEAFDLQKRKREHWSWRPVAKVALPKVAQQSWVIQPTDCFVLSALEREGLKPASVADRPTWLRRASFDLTGLPPLQEELKAFVADRSADAYEKQVDRMLASPRFGEHWARHWMDLVRYSESHGSEGDPDAAGAWRYRDYLIRAFNGDLPYDQFVREHLAGDILPNPRVNAKERANESVLGAIHWRMVEYGFQPLDPMEDKLKWTDNQIDVFAKVFQGLTVSCARCHDHKFDAISQKDYYALFGLFGSGRPTLASIDLPEAVDGQRRALVDGKNRIREELAAVWSHAAKQIPEQLKQRDLADRPIEELFTEKKPVEGKPEKPQADASPLTPLLAMRDQSPEAVRAGWKQQAEQWTAEIVRRREFNHATFPKVLDLRSGSDYYSFIRRGYGLPDAPAKPGDFAIAFAGDQVLTGLFPSGVYSNLLSAKHNAVLQSKRFPLESDSISLRILGGNYSFAQLVLENHAVSRGGTHFRLTVEKDQMGWVRWKTAFWKGLGFTAYIELATAEDAAYFNPVPPTGINRKKGKAKPEPGDASTPPDAEEPKKNVDVNEELRKRPEMVPPKDGRSWFGIQAVYFHDNELTPLDEAPAIAYLFEGREPKSAEDVVQVYAERLSAAVGAWAKGSLTESGAAFLGYFVKIGFLPTVRTASPKLAALVDRYREVENQIPAYKRVPSIIEEAGPDSRLFIRGNHLNLGPVVPWRYLEALDSKPFADHKTARLALADQMLSPADPFTSRVLVNRVWQHLFGAGIVRTVDNFGKLGEAPSHPELLDWLANRFVEEGWSLKKLIRMLAASQAYRMSSTPSEKAAKKDPGNVWLQHMPVRRLGAEAIRDSILYVSGQLDLTMSGPSIPTYYAHDTVKLAGDRPKGPLDGAGRRSVYLEVRRNATNPFLEAFDMPKPVSTRGERDLTNVPAQSLALMNNPFVIDQAEKWVKAALADRVAQSERVDKMFLRALGRQPSAPERDAAQTLLQQLREEGASAGRNVELGAWRGARSFDFQPERVHLHPVIMRKPAIDSFSRREMLRRTSMGFGSLALSSLLAEDGRADSTGARAPHFPPKVKSVIFCFMSGAVSQVDSFDPNKPRLAKEAGNKMPFPIERTGGNNVGTIFPSPWGFKRYGGSGIEVGDLFPHIGSCVDDLCVIRSMTAHFEEHAQANYYFHTGQQIGGYPSIGAWVTYGLGSESRNLPGFVVLGSGEVPLGGVNVFGNGFLPNVYQPSMIFPERPEPLQDIAPKTGDAAQRKQLRFIDAMDRSFLKGLGENAQIESAIANYETAYRMQAAVPELVDLAGETEATKKLYGLDSESPHKVAYAKQCLLARRLVERGVRFVEITMVCPTGSGGGAWDQHKGLKEGHRANAYCVDQPIAGLIKDLKARGLLDQTLVLFSSEFGRTPFAQGSDGRDHDPFAFTSWMAGGGVKHGFVFGATDEYGYKLIENPVSVYDLHVTILHLLGLDHERVRFRYGGRDFKPGDVHGNVVRGILS